MTNANEVLAVIGSKRGELHRAVVILRGGRSVLYQEASKEALSQKLEKYGLQNARIKRINVLVKLS